MTKITTTIMTNAEEFENELKPFFENLKDRFEEKLYSAMQYSLFSGGKRIRPVLSFFTADFLKLDKRKMYPLSIALECIHTYSLIHDDLPCMDNDDLRRGKPTCHKIYGENVALLTGDCLLNTAYELLFDTVAKCPDYLPAASYLAQCAGGEGMIGGQALEICRETFDEASVTELCMKKTGALISAAIIMPCLLSGDNEKLNNLKSYASALGLAFQLSDDLLDADKNETKSYLHILGRDKTEAMLLRLNCLAKKSLEKWQTEGQKLIEFADYIINRKY